MIFRILRPLSNPRARRIFVSHANLLRAMERFRMMDYDFVRVNCSRADACGRIVIGSVAETAAAVHTSFPVQLSGLAPLVAIAADSAEDTWLGTIDVAFSPRLITPARSDIHNRSALWIVDTLQPKPRTQLHCFRRLCCFALCPHLPRFIGFHC